MKVYKIYYIEEDYHWDYVADDYSDSLREVIVKYVDSTEKYYEFIKEVEENSKFIENCDRVGCPIFKMTKRKYNVNKGLLDFCKDKDIKCDGNYVYCQRYRDETKNYDYNQYLYEEIDVE